MGLLVVVAVTMVIVMAAMLVGDTEVPSAAVWAEPSPQPSPPSSMAVRVLFASAADGHVSLDCVDADGEPFTLNAEVGCTVEYAPLFVEAILTKWASTGLPVEMSFVDAVDGVAVRLCGHGSRLQLPLALA